MNMEPPSQPLKRREVEPHIARLGWSLEMVRADVDMATISATTASECCFLAMR